MRIITLKRIKNAMLLYPQWKTGLKLWMETFRQKNLNFESFEQIKTLWKEISGWNVDRVPARNVTDKTFGDAIDLYIFDVHGTDCRIITRIHPINHRIFIRFVGSHQKYDKWCKSNIK